MSVLLRFFLILCLWAPFFPLNAKESSPPHHFFIEGDGVIVLENAHTNLKKTIQYKDKKNHFRPKAQKDIRKVFGVQDKKEKIQLRLIALLDALQDHFGEEELLIVSGYRSPEYNEKLRQQGKTAGKTSLHLEGMAADIIFPKTNAKKIWKYVRSLDCCGAGYYHGNSVHIDTGPARFWTQKTAKTDTDIADHNKRIFMTTDRDIYQPGEEIVIDFGSVSEYPFGIEMDWELYPVRGKKRLPLLSFRPLPPKEGCLMRKKRKYTKNISWKIPKDLPVSKDGLYRLRVYFCSKPHEAMPDFIDSKAIKIVGARHALPLINDGQQTTDNK